jgi:hypothetical protein
VLFKLLLCEIFPLAFVKTESSVSPSEKLYLPNNPDGLNIMTMTRSSEYITIGATAESYQAIIDAIAATSLDCVTGHITFDETGNPIKKCTIIKITNGANKLEAKY